jgi:hypothetical protein
LVLSAFPNDYVPTSTSLIGALHRKGLSIAEVARTKEVDLRSVFSSWLSHDLTAAFPEAGFRKILCFETTRSGSAPDSVGNIFRAIIPFAVGESPIQSVAMPVLAAGDQGYAPSLMLEAIVPAGTHWLAAGLPIKTIKLVVYDRGLAAGLHEDFLRLSNALTLRGAEERETAGAGQYHYFISYAHDDTPDVDLLVRELKAFNPRLAIFQDKLQLNAGQSWQAELDLALESCGAVLAVYSPAYLTSKMCIEEFNMARLRHRESPTPVLKPVYLRNTALPLYMRSLQYIDCREADQTRLTTAARELAAATRVGP